MDYYEVLGILRSASSSEIEFAYKIRRSQYHPDRYAARDAATVVWATTKMQQLNEAYSALSQPETRARFDGMAPADNKNWGQSRLSGVGAVEQATRGD